MVKVDLKGVAKVQSKGRAYYYAWRGGPRLDGKSGSPEFLLGEILACEEARVDKIVCRYVGQSARTAAIIQKRNKTDPRT